MTTSSCPRCLAERALERMREMYAWKPAPDIDPYAHAAGVAEGTLELLLRHPLALCERHDNDAALSTRREAQ